MDPHVCSSVYWHKCVGVYIPQNFSVTNEDSFLQAVPQTAECVSTCCQESLFTPPVAVAPPNKNALGEI